MKKNLALAVCFVMMLGAVAMAAPMVTFDRNAYNEAITDDWRTDWMFTFIGNQAGGQNPGGGPNRGWTSWDFTVANVADGVFAGGKLYADIFSGNGANGNFEASINNDGQLFARHNDANQLNINYVFDTEDASIDAFYLTGFTKHSSWSAGDFFYITVSYYLDGVEGLQTSDTYRYSHPEDFIGIVLAENMQLQSINFQGSATNNNGFRMNMGLGNTPGWYVGGTCDDIMPGTDAWYQNGCDGGGEVPEPGTILLLGSGIIGLGIIARRRMSKK